MASAFLLASIVEAADAASAKLNVSAKAEKNPLTRGSLQKASIVVTDQSGKPIKGALVYATVSYAAEKTTKKFIGKTDEKGSWSFTWHISANSRPGLYGVDIKAIKAGYDFGYGATFFKVIPRNK